MTVLGARLLLTAFIISGIWPAQAQNYDVKIRKPHEPEYITITIVAGHPPMFLWVKHLRDTLVPTVNAALAKTGQYKINWIQAYGGVLAKVGSELEIIESGLADIGFNPSLFNPSKLPMQNVAFISPFNSDRPQLTTKIVESLQRDIPEMNAAWVKFNQVYLGGGVSLDSYQLLSNFPVYSIEDMKGRKIGAPSAVVNWVKGTGAVGVAGNLSNYYNSVKTGVYDGVLLFATAAAPARISEVAPYVTIVNFGTAYAGGITANHDFWKNLPGEVQAAIRLGVEAFTSEFYREQEMLIEMSYARMKKDGAIIYKLNAAERIRWANALPNIARDWADELDSKGFPGSRILEEFMDRVRAAGVVPARNWDRE